MTVQMDTYLNNHIIVRAEHPSPDSEEDLRS